ncbi:MAG: ATP synthase subunit b [Microgenomates group bacterium GW2011_GWA2_46_7]|nr:MAG: ATP synthase subunit b [Microgenomates group bacterium GW2011_GWC2_46_7]KKU45445.1 MAG: ATP synthase subunit b [Microgenomates group bacterium GW2011_GWA2_46_7]
MQINIWQVLFQAFNFGLILYVLTKYLYKPLMKLLDDRAKKINEGQVAAEKNLKSAAESEKTVRAELLKGKKAAANILSDAEKEAKLKSAEIIELARVKAKAEADKIRSDVLSEQSALDKLIEKKATVLATAMVKKALADTLSTKDSEKITSAIIAKLK